VRYCAALREGGLVKRLKNKTCSTHDGAYEPAGREFDNRASLRARLDARASARAIPSVSEGRTGAAREQSLRARQSNTFAEKCVRLCERRLRRDQRG